MKNILFCNTTKPNCGVYQYGHNLQTALCGSNEFQFLYVEPKDEGELADLVRQCHVDAVIYNWHPGQGGWMAGAPFNLFKPVNQILVFHDNGDTAHTSKFDAVLLSDPTMADWNNWHSIPRPVPQYTPRLFRYPQACPLIGVHGFGGASAEQVLARAMAEFDRAYFRAHLPFAEYGDADGAAALNMARHLLKMATHKPSIVVEISHRFMDQEELLAWLSENDLNCYIRDTDTPWQGVSSALDSAMAVRRPIAINKCKGFRHMFDCDPSILLENRSLKEIMATGIKPLQKVYEQNSAANLVARVEQILKQIGL